MGLSEFSNAANPFELFEAWYREAAIAEPRYPDAAQIATVDGDGLPNLRTVLVKAHGPDGFVFYTNRRSPKGRELLATGKGALLYYWKSLSRQVRIRGAVVPVDDATADAYFASRPRASRISAHASRQSEAMTERASLENRVNTFTARFRGRPVPRPSHWSGFRLIPSVVEFWQEGPSRLHDRLAFRLDGGAWRSQLLYP